MKNSLKFAILFFLSGIMGTQLSAQCLSPGSADHEIGIRLFALTDESMAGGVQVNEASMLSSFLKGIHYKHFDSFGAFRASLSYSQHTVDRPELCQDCLQSFGESTGLKIKAGYEVYGYLGPIEPYIGLDLMYMRGWYDGHVEGTGLDGEYTYIDLEANRLGFGVSPAVGVRAYISYALSISAETNLDLAYVTNKTISAYSFPETQTLYDRSTVSELRWHPVGELSLNVIF